MSVIDFHGSQIMPIGSLIVGHKAFLESKAYGYMPAKSQFQFQVPSLLKRDSEPRGAVLFQHIFSGKEELNLIKPLAVSVKYEKNVWMMKNVELDISCTSSDYDTCVKEFNDDFLFIWKQYGMEEEINLTADAKALKDKILRYVERSTIS